jgi:hypothetical protein
LLYERNVIILRIYDNNAGLQGRMGRTARLNSGKTSTTIQAQPLRTKLPGNARESAHLAHLQECRHSMRIVILDEMVPEHLPALTSRG